METNFGRSTVSCPIGRTDWCMRGVKNIATADQVAAIRMLPMPTHALTFVAKVDVSYAFQVPYSHCNAFCWLSTKLQFWSQTPDEARWLGLASGGVFNNIGSSHRRASPCAPWNHTETAFSAECTDRRPSSLLRRLGNNRANRIALPQFFLFPCLFESSP